jgi:hypothetical protein
MNMRSLSKQKLFLLFAAVVLILCGVLFRIYRIRNSGFFFYDEGFYLKHNFAVLDFIRSHALRTPEDIANGFWYYFRSALGSGKSLWFFMIDARFLWGGLFDWGFSRVAACFWGLMSIPVVFIFSRRYYGSSWVGVVAAALFAVLPGAVFYSRTGLQEALSIFLVLSGFFLYMFPRRFGWRSCLSGAVFAAAFFSNYRLVMLPLSLLLCEWISGLGTGGGFSLRRYLWSMLVFAACVVVVGGLCGGVNTTVIAMWVFHQGSTAGADFAWVNLLSYPYYLFRLETFLFALCFFSGMFFIFKRRWDVCLPMALVLFHMFFFSFTSEKGARYTAVMLPFMAMTAAYMLKVLWHSSAGSARGLLLVLSGAMVVLMLSRSAGLAQGASDHEKAVNFLLSKDINVRCMSSQEMVDGLYLIPGQRVMPVPPRFEGFASLYAQGYRYLLLDPQAYVSLVEKHKFTLPLRDYLAFIDGKIEPLKTFPHMNREIFERFVFEHTENLGVAVHFLSSFDIEHLSSIRIYDLDRVVPPMVRIYEQIKAAR